MMIVAFLVRLGLETIRSGSPGKISNLRVFHSRHALFRSHCSHLGHSGPDTVHRHVCVGWDGQLPLWYENVWKSKNVHRLWDAALCLAVLLSFKNLETSTLSTSGLVNQNMGLTRGT